MGWAKGLVALQLFGLVVSSMCSNIGEGLIDEKEIKLISPNPPAPVPTKAPPPPVLKTPSPPVKTPSPPVKTPPPSPPVKTPPPPVKTPPPSPPVKTPPPPVKTPLPSPPVKIPPPPVKTPPPSPPVKTPPPPVKAPPPSPPVKTPPPPVKTPPHSPPVKTPPPPVKAPPPPPPPVKPTPRPVKVSAAVEGVIYCASCKMPGYAPSLNASPLHGAVVALVCRSKLGITNHGNSATDTKGYFFIQVQNMKKPSIMPGACKVVVRPPAFCNKPIIPKNLQYGVPPKYERTEKAGPSKLVLFTVGFLEFGPSRPGLCPRQR